MHRVVTGHLDKIQPANKHLSPTNLFRNCPIIENDEDVVTSNEFIIPLNSDIKNSKKSRGSAYNDGHIFRLKIVNKKFIPSTIFGLKYLKHLEIRNTCFSPCSHQQIPPEIQCLASSLDELSIYDTKITHLPNEIVKLKRLRVLKLSNTGLMFLPDSIGHLSSLTLLYLPNNNLKLLPATIGNLRKLEHITLTNNPYLHSVEPLNGLPSLKSLDTKHCPVAVLPQNLPNLTDLYMTNNSLTKLSDIETLGDGTNSKKFFYFDMNDIQSIPPLIQQVKNLSHLHLNHNQLNYLPTNIFNVTTLSYLNIKHNRFHRLDLQTIISTFRATNPNLTILHD